MKRIHEKGLLKSRNIGQFNLILAECEVLDLLRDEKATYPPAFPICPRHFDEMQFAQFHY